MFCTECGSALEPDAAFCSECGAKVVGAAVPAASPPSVTAKRKMPRHLSSPSRSTPDAMKTRTAKSVTASSPVKGEDRADGRLWDAGWCRLAIINFAVAVGFLLLYGPLLAGDAERPVFFMLWPMLVIAIGHGVVSAVAWHFDWAGPCHWLSAVGGMTFGRLLGHYVTYALSATGQSWFVSINPLDPPRHDLPVPVVVVSLIGSIVVFGITVRVIRSGWLPTPRTNPSGRREPS